MKRKLAYSVLVIGAWTAVYWWAVRPWHLRWGATDLELKADYFGDEMVPHPTNVCTRAITIDAPPSKVWPWIAQIGQDRAGFYSYTVLENMFLAGMKNADRIVPEWQTRNEGDIMWLANKDRFEGKGHMIVAKLVPEKALIVVAPPDWPAVDTGKPAKYGTWAWLLFEENGGKTRLIMRTRGGETGYLSNKWLDKTFWEPAHFVMERGMMKGIKRRAEQTSN